MVTPYFRSNPTVCRFEIRKGLYSRLSGRKIREAQGKRKVSWDQTTENLDIRCLFSFFLSFFFFFGGGGGGETGAVFALLLFGSKIWYGKIGRCVGTGLHDRG